MPPETNSDGGQDGQPGGTPPEGGGSPTANGGSQPGQGDKSFTQDDVNRIVSERLNKERQKTGDVEQLRKDSEELQKLKDAERSETEKLQNQVDSEKQGRTKAEERARTLSVQLAVLDVASKSDSVITDPALAVRLVNQSNLEFGDDDEPTEKSMKDELDRLVKAHPILAGGRPAGSADGGSRKPAEGTSMNDLIRQRAGRS